MRSLTSLIAILFVIAGAVVGFINPEQTFIDNASLLP
jgi:hypothetical protein